LAKQREVIPEREGKTSSWMKSNYFEEEEEEEEEEEALNHLFKNLEIMNVG